MLKSHIFKDNLFHNFCGMSMTFDIVCFKDGFITVIKYTLEPSLKVNFLVVLF